MPEKKIRMPTEKDEFLYFTQRSVYARGDPRKENWGTTEHKVKVWVFKDEPTIANVEYSCPYCGYKGLKQQKWERPFVVTCDNCGKKIRVPKLK